MSDVPCVFVVDDDPAVRDSLASLLRSQDLPTECFASAEAFCDAVDPARPGCLVVDLRMPGMTGIQLLQKLADEGNGRPTVVITGHAEIESVVTTMKLGAIDFLQKPFLPDKLIEAVQAALAADERERARLLQRRECRRRLEALTVEEQTVMSGIVRGLTNQQIADKLDVSLRTVQFRRASLFAALGVNSRSELVALAQQAGWLTD